MPNVYLYREGITKQAGLFVGVGRAYRSMRASWSACEARIDDGGPIRLKSGLISKVELSAGRHEVICSGSGYVGSSLAVNLVDGRDVIVGIVPRYLDGVSASTPLGTLAAYQADSPQDLGTYAFYRGLTIARGGGVTSSVVVSMLVSAAFLALGLLSLAAVAVGAIARSPAVGAILLVPCLFVASVSVPAGIGGVTTGLRFLRLPREWK